MGDNPVQVTLTISPRLAQEIDRMAALLRKDRAAVMGQAFSLFSIYVDQLVIAQAGGQEVVLVRRTRGFNRALEVIEPRV